MGMHGPACIFWANLTPFLLKAAATVATASTAALPAHWTKDVGEVEVVEGSAEWAQVAERFHGTCPAADWRLLRVARVQDPLRWRQHELERARMAELCPGPPGQVKRP